MGRGNFEEEGRHTVKYRDTLRSSVQKMAELIEVPFGLRTWMGPRNHYYMGVQMPPWEWKFFGKGASIVKYGDFLP